MTTPLFTRSVYSLLSSMCSIEGIISSCLKNGYKACAIVDKNVLSGAMVFKKACMASNIKPIYGLEFEIEVDDRIHEMMMLSKNDEGFKNLMGLSSMISSRDNKTINIEELNKYRNDNILVLFSDDMDLSFGIEKNSDVLNILNRTNELYGDYYVGLCNHDIVYNKNRDLKLKELLKEHNIKYFALNKTYYLNKEDYEDYEVLTCIKDKTVLSNEHNRDFENRYFLSQEEYSNLYSDDELNNSDLIASLCNVDLNYKTNLPTYPTKNNVSSKDYLVNLSRLGLNKRLNNNVSKEYLERLDYELKIIIKMNFIDYFLIVYDFVLYAKKNGIFVGPGRGSAAGSLVAYCLGITDVDPLKHGLLFERFLNPERISMPDIDTDFEDTRRQEVIDYVKEKYGINHVAHIITYGTLKAKQVIRDVGRVLEYSNMEVDAISKMIPLDPKATLMSTYNNVPLFKQKIESDKRYRRLFKIALKLEGFPRHESTHAAGIVFSKSPLNDVVPTIKIEEDIYSTQYTMEHLEELGLIKMDFLSIRNLSIISEIVKEINKDEVFDIKKISLSDPNTFKLIDDVNLLGIFQLESEGMRNLALKMKPKTFEEIGEMIALFRPGPMENIDEFLKNRANKDKIEYLVPELKPILEETYGIIVYQEQIMSIARVLANFTYGKADILRRAMSKKKKEELDKLKDDFIEGCKKNGYSFEISNKLYDLIEKFANYGFNKAHSVVYALVAYEMAYLKANYPKYFYKALLNGTIGSETKTYEYIHECISIGQNVKHVSINDSYLEYSIKVSEIIMPFTCLKDVGRISANKIVLERNNGLFKDYLDAMVRLVNVGVERNVLENLIYAGAFDEFKYSRFTLIKSFENVLKYASVHKGVSLDLGFDDRPIIENYKDDKNVLALNEKRVYGFYLSYNPIIEIKKENNINTPSISAIRVNSGYTKGFGQIKRVKTHKTKKGDMMAFVDIGDDTGDMSLVIMPDLFRNSEYVLNKDAYIYFEGNIEKEGSCLLKRLKVIGGENA